MSDRFWLTKNSFLMIAEALGLDTAEEHMNELYSFAQSILSGFKEVEKLDLAGMEPFMPRMLRQGGGHE